jgi:hypothetical protein
MRGDQLLGDVAQIAENGHAHKRFIENVEGRKGLTY